MFHFNRRLSASAFAVRAWISTTAFAATIFGFPLLQYAILKWSSCSPDVCGALGLVAGLWIKPIFFYSFVAFLAGISVPRARDLGLPALCGLFLPLIVLGDSSFALFAGAGWAATFSAGIWFIEFPVFLLDALALIVFLSLAPTDSLHPGNHPRLQQLALSFAVILCLCAFWRNLPVSILLAIRSTPVFWVNALIGHSTVLIAPLLALLFALAWANRHSPQLVDDRTEQREVAHLQWKIKHAAVITVIVTVAVFVWDRTASNIGVTPTMALFSLPIALRSIIVPTFLLYFCVTCAVMQLCARRNAWSLALLIVSSAPFWLWASAKHQTYQAKVAEAAKVAAVPTVSIDHVPSTLVFSGYSYPIFCASIDKRVSEIKEVIQETSSNSYNEEDCRFARRNGVVRELIKKLPDEFLRLISGRDSAFAKNGQIYNAMGQPLELRCNYPPLFFEAVVRGSNRA